LNFVDHYSLQTVSKVHLITLSKIRYLLKQLSINKLRNESVKRRTNVSNDFMLNLPTNTVGILNNNNVLYFSELDKRVWETKQAQKYAVHLVWSRYFEYANKVLKYVRQVILYHFYVKF